MKPFASALLLLVACGGSTSPAPAAAVTPFIGVWSGTLTTTVTCPSEAPATAPASVVLPIAAGTGADLGYTSGAGCQFKFNVAGNTAALSNGPVTCTSSPTGTPTTLIVNSYTLTTTDGHNLTAASSGTVAQASVTCTFTLTGAATK
jgi:hypothetical protein